MSGQINMQPSEFIESLSQKFNVKRACNQRMRECLALMKKGTFDVARTASAPETAAVKKEKVIAKNTTTKAASKVAPAETAPEKEAGAK